MKLRPRKKKSRARITVGVRLPRETILEIERAVDEHQFETVSAFIREAVGQKLVELELGSGS